MGIDDVFDARMAWPGVISSSWAKRPNFGRAILADRLDHQIDIGQRTRVGVEYESGQGSVAVGSVEAGSVDSLGHR